MVKMETPQGSEAKFKLSEEMAIAEWERFMDTMDLDRNQDTKDGDDLKGLLLLRGRMVHALRLGTLVVNDDGEPVYSLANGQELTFHEPKGDALLAMDKKGKNHDIAKLNAVMAVATKQHPGMFTKLPNREYRVCSAITSLFLA